METPKSSGNTPNVTTNIPLDAIEVDWTNNLSRQFLNKEHMTKRLAEMLESRDFKEFARSIKDGLINPILVTPQQGKAKGFRLTAGYRRFEAAKSLGWKEIPCRVLDTDPFESDRLNVIENVERKDISTFELASAATLFYRKHNLKSEEVGKHLHKSPEYIRGLVMYREKLVPEILQAWADRDEKNPAAYRATTLPNLASYAALPAKEQLPNFQVQVLMAEGKTEEEARKIVSAGGFKWDEDDGKGKRGTKGKGKSVKTDVLKQLRKRLIAADLPQSESALREAAVNTLGFLLGKSKTIKAGKVTLWDPATEEKEADDE